jgi:integrase
LLSDLDVITTKWKIFDVKNCICLKDILKTNIYDKTFEVSILKQLKLIEKFRGKMACITTFQDLRLLLKFAKQNKLLSCVPDLQVIVQNMPKKSKRDAYIKTKEQMTSFVDACYASPHGGIFIIALLTCSRIGDIIEMRWSDINLDEKKWSYLPQKQKKDNKEKVHVPLSNEVIRLLKERNTATTKVFDGYYHRDVVRKWDKIKQNTTKDMKDLHIHDLRRTHLHWSNIQDYLIAQHCLGHKVSKSAAAIYLSNAATFEQRYQLVQNLEYKILNINQNKETNAHQT